jgi:basic membrane protein A
VQKANPQGVRYWGTMVHRSAFLRGSAIAIAAGTASFRPVPSAAAGLRLAMVTDTGGLGDQSFNDSAYRGLKDAQAELRAEIVVLQSRSAADYQPNLTALANKSYDEIYAIGFLMAKDLDEVAARFPARRFAIIDAVVARPNVVSVTFREEEGSFLAGAAAALASKSKTVAFLGGLDIPLLRKFEAGFTAGARQINPSISVLVKYVGSFDDVAAGRELAGVLFNDHADVLFAAAGKAGLGAIDQVKSRSGLYVIGVDSDQDGLAPGKILTSMIKRVDVGVLDTARAVAKQRPPSGHVELGLRDGAIGLSSFRYTKNALTADQFKRLEVLRRAIASKRIIAPSTREELAKFHPIPL